MSVIDEAKKYIEHVDANLFKYSPKSFWEDIKSKNTQYQQAKSLIEYDQALREAKDTINTLLCYKREIGIKVAGEFKDKYKHLLEDK